tara:strand:+ start:542 stop:1351 length:810 start_codon:yes stop_codon:yes gene_type:complete
MRPSEREKMLAKARKMRERKKSTYDEVPSGRLTSRVQAMKDAADGRKGAKATSGTVVTFKDTGSGKGADPKGLFKPRPKTQANRAKSQGGRSAAEVAASKKGKDPRGNQVKATPGTAKKKEAAKKYNVGVSKGGVSFKEAFKYYRGQGNKTFTWNGKKYTTDVKKAAPKAKVSTPTPADFSTSAKKDTKSKDPRGNQIKATPGKKGPLASARKEYPVTGPGSQSKILRPKKAADKIPAGAKRLTSKGYDSKKFKLQKINGETYVVPKGK